MLVQMSSSEVACVQDPLSVALAECGMWHALCSTHLCE